MLAVVKYIHYLDRENINLDGIKIRLPPRGHLSPRMLTIDARIIYAWIPNIKVEDFDVSRSFLPIRSPFTLSWVREHIEKYLLVEHH